MALNIKDPETDRLARELAALTGDSITVALHRAITDRLERVRAAQRVVPHDDLAEIIRRGRARTVLDSRTEDELLGYGPDGLPR